MLSSPILKGLNSYLASLDATAAVYDSSFKLAAAVNMDFFEQLDISAVKENPPSKGEKFYSLDVNGEKLILAVTPLFKSKRIVTAYTFVVRDEYQLYKQICVGASNDYFIALLDRMQDGLRKCCELNETALNQSGGKKLAAVLEEQRNAIDELRSEIFETRLAAFPSSEVNSRINCNVSALLSALCSDTAECLQDIKRKVSAEIDEKSYYSNIDFNLFTVAFTNLIRYHLQCSPLKSTVSIKSELNSDNFLEIMIKTKSDAKRIESGTDAVLAKYFRDFANRIIRSNFDGEYDHKQEGNMTVSIVRLYVSKKNRGSLLTGKNSAYLSDDYKPMRSSLARVINSEKDEMKTRRSSKKTEQ